MSSDADTTTEEHEGATERTVIREGRDFEREYRLSAGEAGRFLVKLGEQLQGDGELTIVDDGEGWELPFAFGEPVAMEVDFEGAGEPELEIEVEIPGNTGDEAPDVR